MEQAYVDDEYIKKHGGYVYGDEDVYEPNLPTTESLMTQLMPVLEYMASDEMLKLKHIDKNEYSQNIESKFPAFVDRYYSVYKQFVDADIGVDISPLCEMIKEIDKVNRGVKSFEKAEKRMNMGLAEKFIPAELRKK